jgi:sugar phosphate isomerase/epimerase
MDRRQFTKSIFLSAAAMKLAPAFSENFAARPLGAQLWTIREPMKKDLPGSLKKLADLGYNEIELFGYNGSFWGHSAKDFGQICSDVGLTIISSHYDTGRTDHAMGTLVNGWDQAVADAASLKIKYMICAWLVPEERVSMDLYKQLADMLNKAGETCKKANIQFGYHSHNFEFPSLNGIVPYDYLLEHTDPNLVKMEADLYWIIKAKQDPVKYFNKYPGRFPLWHVKDMEKGTEDFTEVGQGTIDFDRIFAARKTAGLKYWFVEQDECKHDPFESLAISRDYLRKKNY